MASRLAGAFTLVEVLVVMAIGAILLALGGTALSAAQGGGKKTECTARMRNLGTAIQLYAQDHEGEFPRSLHSAASAGKQPWSREILTYLGYEADPDPATWEGIFNKAFRCPEDASRNPAIWSYGLNVFFELTPDGDDYAGSPQTWRRSMQVERPGATILLAEPKAVYYADHLMSHLWTTSRGASNAVDSRRHGTAANYLFVDGHVESLRIEDTFDPARGINRWNPSVAR